MAHKPGWTVRQLRVALTASMVAALALAVVASPGTALAGTAARTVVVPNQAPTIQAAVDAAAPGSTIVVRRGTYREELVIDKDLTLRGEYGATIVSPASLTPFATHLPDGRPLTAIVRVGGAAHVRMSGFTVTGPIPCGVEVTGVQVLESATLALSNTRVTHIQTDPTACAPQDAAGRAIVYGLPPHIVLAGQHGSPAFGAISGVTIDHYQHAGVSITGPDDGTLSKVVVRGSTIRGGWTLPSFQYGVDIEAGASAGLVGNTITGVVCGGPPCGPDPINEMQGAGVIVSGAAGQVDVVGNRFSGNDVGVYQVVSPDCCRIVANRLVNNRFFGIVIQDGDGTATANAISGGQVGVGVVADFIDTTAQLNADRITGTTVAPVQEIECCGAVARAHRNRAA